VGDRTSKNLFEEILADEEHHIDYLETQLHLLDTLGEQLYLAGQIEHPTPGDHAE
jgi:bacterioferritin